MFDFYKKRYNDFTFYGYDISEEMINNAEEIHKNDNNAKWYTDLNNVPDADFVIASGIFNVRLKYSEKEWLEYIIETLNVINNKAIKGFSFNMLTIYSAVEYMKEYIYFANPLFIFDYCKRIFFKYVFFKHDYLMFMNFQLIQKNRIEEILIFGLGDFAQIANYYFKIDSKFRVVAFTVDKEFVKNSDFEGLPVISFNEILTKYPLQILNCLLLSAITI